MTDSAQAAGPGASDAELDALEQGAWEFFGSQGESVLLEFLRREGGNPLPGEFAALAAPARREEPARRDHCMKCPDGCIHGWI